MTLHLRPAPIASTTRAEILAEKHGNQTDRLCEEANEMRPMLRWPLPVNLNARGAS